MSTRRKLHKHDEAALLLASGYTSELVGEKLGVAASTVRTWRQEPEFRAKIARCRAEILEEATAMMAGGARRAVGTLLEAMNKGEDTAVRVRAASAFLQQLPLIADHVLLEQKVAEYEAERAAEASSGGER